MPDEVVKQTASRLPKGILDPGDPANSHANRVGYWLRNKLLPVLGPIHSATNPVSVGDDGFTIPGWLNAGVTGSVLGAGLGGLSGLLLGNPMKHALVGAGIGGLGLGGLGYMRGNPDWAQDMGFDVRRGDNALRYDKENPLTDLSTEEQELKLTKESMFKVAYGMSNAGSDIVRKLYRDTELTLRQKQELASQVNNLNNSELQRLDQMVRGAIGGGVGYLVAKYLLGLGKFGTILTTIVSGLASSRFGGGAPSRPSDSMGRPYYM